MGTGILENERGCQYLVITRKENIMKLVLENRCTLQRVCSCRDGTDMFCGMDDISILAKFQRPNRIREFVEKMRIWLP